MTNKQDMVELTSVQAPWNSDDVIQRMVQADPSEFTKSNLKRFYSCYGIGVVGEEKTGNIVLATIRKGQKEDKETIWNNVLRYTTVGHPTAAVQQWLTQTTAIANELIRIKHLGWEFSLCKSKQLAISRHKYTKKSNIGNVSLKIVESGTTRIVYKKVCKTYSRSSWNKQLNTLLHDLQQINATPSQTTSKFDDLYVAPPSIPFMLLTLRPDISTKQLSAVAADAEQLLAEKDDDKPMMAVLHQLLEDSEQQKLGSAVH